MSIYVISSIVLLVIVLIGYMLITQAVEKRRLHKHRLLMALQARQRNFRHIVSGFPPHFLSSDLMALIYRALLDTCEQLIRLDRQDPKHKQDLLLYTNQFNNAKHEAQAKRPRIESPELVKEIQQHLQELYRFIIQQREQKAISHVQAAAFVDQIKRLSLECQVEGYVIQANNARQAEKTRLAIHYFNLARKFLTQENAQHTYDDQINRITETIRALEQQAADSPTSVQDDIDIADSAHGKSTSLINKEWEQFGNDDDEWKKKQVYD